MVNNAISKSLIKIWISWCHGRKAIHITVVETKQCGYQNGIMNFQIGSTCLLCTLDRFIGNTFTTLLNLPGNCKQGSHLLTDWCSLYVFFNFFGSIAFTK